MLNRREFLTKLIRNGSLLTLAAGSGYLLLREPSDEVCDFSFVCKNCKKVKSCTLPQADEYLKSTSHE